MGILLGVILLYLIDWFVKGLVEKKVDENQEYIIGKGWIRIRKFYNPGAAMGFLKEKPQLLNTITVLVTAFFAALLFFTPKQGRDLEKGAYMLILGGALNNGSERLLKRKVTDYIGFPKLPGVWKQVLFNLSDFFILIGGVLLAVSEWKGNR